MHMFPFKNAWVGFPTSRWVRPTTHRSELMLSQADRLLSNEVFPARKWASLRMCFFKTVLPNEGTLSQKKGC